MNPSNMTLAGCFSCENEREAASAYLVATWWLYSLSPGSLNSRARPKSAIFRCPDELMRRFAGFRSCTQMFIHQYFYCDGSQDRRRSVDSYSSHPVYDVVVMQERHTLQKHHHVTLDLGWGQRSLGVSNDLREVREHEVKDQDEACTMREDVLQVDHLRGRMSVCVLLTSDLNMASTVTHVWVVLHLLQSLDLPQRLVGDAVLQPSQSHLLQRHRLASLRKFKFICIDGISAETSRVDI